MSEMDETNNRPTVLASGDENSASRYRLHESRSENKTKFAFVPVGEGLDRRDIGGLRKGYAKLVHAGWAGFHSLLISARDERMHS